ncbi:hypothetical protein GIB67_035352, partial [Kingdonia uniflora]
MTRRSWAKFQEISRLVRTGQEVVRTNHPQRKKFQGTCQLVRATTNVVRTTFK